LKVVITMGDPSGIGPEVTLKALASPAVAGLADFFVIGDGGVIEKASRLTGERMDARLVDLENVRSSAHSYGRVSGPMGMASIGYLDKALDLIANGVADCLVTGPVNKESIRSAGYGRFQGHTEYLAEKTGSKECAMMFVGPRLKITLVTRHIALKDVGRSISRRSILRAIGLTHKYLGRYFAIKRPRIAVAGLNPHAGEDGAFGREEHSIISPAVRAASEKMPGVSGPYSPDVIFHEALDGKYDAVIAMYHDQALIPFKLLYFMDGVNLTLGLPFVRTSPDHGTAFDIAGRNVADPSSMIEAIKLACRLSKIEKCSR
jgi:4-hydroxythreonine-4-phosphate dehydrogenase